MVCSCRTTSTGFPSRSAVSRPASTDAELRCQYALIRGVADGIRAVVSSEASVVPTQLDVAVVPEAVDELTLGQPSNAAPTSPDVPRTTR